VGYVAYIIAVVCGTYLVAVSRVDWRWYLSFAVVLIASGTLVAYAEYFLKKHELRS